MHNDPIAHSAVTANVTKSGFLLDIATSIEIRNFRIKVVKKIV